jgi:hypothetical protein
MGRRVIVASVAALAVAAGITAAAVLAADRAPGRLVMGDDVPDDLRELATGVFAAVEERFPARLDCMGDVRLVPIWEGLDDRARYLPDAAVIELRVPATANLLRDSLVHEIAHHLEFTCPEIAELRPGFLAAQGHPASADWYGGERWEEIPSEQFAEAVVQVVLGGRQQHRLTMPITAEAVAAVEAWGAGRS